MEKHRFLVANKIRRFVIGGLLAASTLGTGDAFASVSILNLGTLPGGTRSFGMAVSSDGSTVAGLTGR